MQPNSELVPLGAVAKADLAVSQLASGGLLANEQMKKFLVVAIRASTALQMARVTTMKAPTQEIPKLTTMGRVMRPAVEATALPVAQRSRPGFSSVTMTTVEGKAEVHWPRRLLEDQVEREGFSNTLLNYLGEHVSGDIDDMICTGDLTDLTDEWLALQDGMLTGTTSNVYPAGSVTLNRSILKNLIATEPQEYDARSGMAFYTCRKARADYLDSLGDRATPLGDVVITGQQGRELGYGGVPLRTIPRFPTTWNPGGNSTNVWYGSMKDVIVAFGRKMTVDKEFRISPQVYVVVITMRLCVGFEHEAMASKATQVRGS